MEESKLIETIKPQLFNFKIKQNKIKQTNKNTNQRSQSQKLGYENDPNFFASEQLQWRPKIPTKKLFEQPQFLISIQRRKLRGISETKDLQIFQQIKRRKIPIDRIKIKHQTIRQQKQVSPLKQDKSDTHYIHTQFSLPTKNPQKQCKAFMVNFNLQHLIDKRKKFKSQQNSPKKYCSYMSPQKTIENKIQKSNDLQINLNIIDNKLDRPLTYTNIRRKSSNKNKTWYQSSRTQILHILQ